MNKKVYIIFCAFFYVIDCDQITDKLPPTITSISEPIEYVVQAGTELKFDCKATGIPQPEYKWSHNGTMLDEFKVNGSLRIPNVTSHHNGQYQCFAKNNYGTATSIDISVVVKQFIRRHKDIGDATPEIIDGFEYEAKNITCPFDDKNQKIFWTKIIDNGNDDYPGFTGFKNERFSNDDKKLYISHLLSSDTDTLFACYYELFDTVFSYKFYLNVKSQNDKTGAPTSLRAVSIGQSNKHAIVNKTYVLNCIYSGYPTPQVTWFKDSQAMKFDDRIQTNEAKNSITIKTVKTNDAGDYKCVINGKLNQTFHVDVWETPAFVKAPTSLNVTIGDQIEVKCEAKGFPEPKIEWTKNGQPINITVLQISAIALNDTSNYGCKASNDVGHVYKDFFLNVLSLSEEEEVETTSETIITLPHVVLANMMDINGANLNIVQPLNIFLVATLIVISFF